jgi:hypothetical protein
MLSATAAVSQEKTPVLKEFAGRIELTGEANSLLSLEIPQLVYQGLERSDMRDMMVFDANGIPVPFTIRTIRYDLKGGDIPQPQSVPFFIWKPAKNQGSSDNRNIEINVTGAVVNIKDSQGIFADTPVILADISSLPQSPEALQAEFDHGGDFFNSTVTIHSSSDLNNWQLFNKWQTIAYYGNTGMDKTMFEIPPNVNYVLIKFDEQAPPLLSISAHFPKVYDPQKMNETIINGEKNADGMSVYYDTKGYYPVRSVDFRFTQPDAILVNIKNQYDYPDGPFNLQRQEHLFKINTASETLTNNPIAITGDNAPGRHWTLSAAGEIPFVNIPVLAFKWESRILTFLSRGEGPWTLAYGNASYGSKNEDSLNITGVDEPNNIYYDAVIGESSYTPRAPAAPDKNWPQWILWGILILTAGVLTVLALFVNKQWKSGKA